MSDTAVSVVGVVLCGGRSQRMGRDKAWLPFGDETLLQRVVHQVSRGCHSVAVVAAPDQHLPTLSTEVKIFRDSEPHLGPLSGLAVALRHLEHQHAVYLTSCDAPFLQPGWIPRLCELVGHHKLAMPSVQGFLQPLAALYHRSVRDDVETLLAQGERRLTKLAERADARIVSQLELQEVDPTWQTLRNLNTPELYEAAVAELKSVASCRDR